MGVSDLEERRAKRFKFLELLYDKVSGDEFDVYSVNLLGRDLGFDETEAGRIAQYLAGEGLIEFQAMGDGGMVSLTHAGVREIDEALTNKDTPTAHFPPLNVTNNIIHMPSAQNTTIQQGGQGGTQNVAYPSSSLEDLAGVIRRLRSEAAGMGLSPEDAEELTEQLDTIEEQVQAKRPKRPILQACVTELGGFLTRTASGVAATEIAHQLQAMHF
jgi:hypothetical protein